ncbi:hypothetical protein PENSPDRAFT_657105 [Peniophora sp. CONT]|nr:hypothetical protein PENSPDRAFT_657105 [Peniophora sp. CONT]
MSTVSFFDGSHLLPLELWPYVFEHASDIPHELSHVHDPFLDPTSDTATMTMNPRSFRPIFASALSTRANIVRVCRAWHIFGTPLLYRTVYIYRAGDLPRLAETLAARAHGKHVRRVDVLPNYGALDFGELRFLLSVLGGLEVLNICPLQYVTRTVPSDFLRALADTAGSSLRVLIWPSWPSLSCKGADYTALLEQCTQLRVLCIGPWRMEGGACTFVSPPQATPRFVALAEHDESHVAPRRLYPALEHVFLVYNRIPDLTCQAAFLGAHADTLTTATINVSGYHRSGELVLAALEQCHRLRHLVLVTTANFAATPKHVQELCTRIPRTVVCVGMRILQFRHMEREMTGFVRGLTENAGALPNTVKVVRIMNDLGSAVPHDELLACSLALFRRGILLEGLQGKVIPASSAL